MHDVHKDYTTKLATVQEVIRYIRSLEDYARWEQKDDEEKSRPLGKRPKQDIWINLNLRSLLYYRPVQDPDNLSVHLTCNTHKDPDQAGQQRGEAADHLS